MCTRQPSDLRKSGQRRPRSTLRTSSLVTVAVSKSRQSISLKMLDFVDRHPVVAIAGVLLVVYIALHTLLAKSPNLPDLPWSGKKSKLESLKQGRTWLANGYQKVSQRENIYMIILIPHVVREECSVLHLSRCLRRRPHHDPQRKSCLDV